MGIFDKVEKDAEEAMAQDDPRLAQQAGQADAVQAARQAPGGSRPGIRTPCSLSLRYFLGMPEPLSNVVEAGWAEALAPVEGQIARMGAFLREQVAAGKRYLPAGDQVLRAFKQPFADVRVLIVGQDPYPTPGHPVGLSFSVNPAVRPLPGSLVNIFREYSSDLGYPAPSNGDLTPWAEHGVLLLNRVLTVEPGKPRSHQGKGWEQVTEQAIRALAGRGGPLVAILWGRDARELAPLLGSVPRIESVHPSPMSAHNGFFGTRPFSRANELLERQGAAPVNWKLP